MRARRKSMRHLAIIILISFLYLLLNQNRGNAFSIFTHPTITAMALTIAGYPDLCVSLIAVAARNVDFFESTHIGDTGIPNPLNITGAYSPSHHFDRNKGHGEIDHTSPDTEISSMRAASFNAFMQGLQYLQDERHVIKAQFAAGNIFEAIEALGRALHALQDFFSHSNFMDLDINEQILIEKALLYDPTTDPPMSFTIPPDLQITAFGNISLADPSPHIDPFDPYPHDDIEFHGFLTRAGQAKDKDDPNDPSRHRAHLLAVDNARVASVAWINKLGLSFPLGGDECVGGWVDSGLISVVRAFDPNEKVGSQGTGRAHYLAGVEPLRYVVSFENVDTATAPAQEVVISDQLDTGALDLTTFSLGLITFGDTLITPPPGLSQYTTDVDLRPAHNLIVRINAGLDMATGLVTWRFISLDLATHLPTEDPLAGFLPPNQMPPEGQGSVLLTVKPKQGLPTGTEIRNQASIVFDTNAPILTPEWFNTLDTTTPASHVLPLAATQPSPSFAVQWSGMDAGSGILDYTIFVAENSGLFTPFVSNTTATSATFTGQPGKTYAFFSVARDQTGNQEAPKMVAEVTTRVMVPISGDLNGDGKVDCSDLAIVKGSFGKHPGQAGFDAKADTNNDGVVNVKDLAFVAQKLPVGTRCP